MKKHLITLLFAAAALVSDAASVHNKFRVDTEVCDPVLIYTGGLSKRADWTEARNIRPYLTHGYADGTRDWFYDSFIYNETNWYDKATGETRVLVNAGGGQLPANKGDWDNYLNHVLGPDGDLHALDAQIDVWKATLGEPRLRHKIIMGMPFPCKDGRGTPKACEWKKFNFGEIDGEDMDFSREAHQLKAAYYAVDEIIRLFNEGNFKNIDLVGIYCPEETLYSISHIIRRINDYIHTKDLRTYWIPFWTGNDQYALNWAEYGFDIAYRQPNYFFYANPLPTKMRLYECIDQCKTYGLGLELEFETSNPSNALYEFSPSYHQRLIDYLDYFEKYGVWAESGVAHYGGSKGYVDMASSMSPENQAVMDRLADIVRTRQKAMAEELAGVESSPVLPESPFAYAGQGEIFISNAPDATIYSLAGIALFHGEGSHSCNPGIYIVSDGHGRTCKVSVR
ncbi:MAG: DUF4855 domain-containing protein [Bacteroidales bacterium]|nr:DUF4855 domain-containing protein [Bacteroidales bacterium]